MSQARKASSALVDEPTGCRFVRLDEMAAATKASVVETGYPEYSGALRDALTARAVAEVEAAAALPIDRDKSHADRHLIDQLELLGLDRATAAANHLAACRSALDARATKAALPKPLGLAEWSLTVAVLLGILVVATIALAGHLAPSIDAFILHRYVASVLLGEADLFTAQLAFYLGLLTSALCLASPMAVVLRTRGEIGWPTKGLIVLAEFLFAGAYAVMRLGGTFSWQGLSVSLIELAITLLVTAVVFGVGRVLRRDISKIEPYNIATARLRAARGAEEEAKAAVDVAEARLAEHLRIVASREEAARRQEAHARLARATADAGYLVAFAQLVNDAARDPGEEMTMAAIERRLVSGLALQEGESRQHD